MREIKFRGLSANREWRYGDLLHDRKGETAYYNEFSQRICWEHCNQPVKNGTVGQYTGLKDKNEKEIYEGDIVKIHRNWSEDGTCCMNEEIGQVEYSDGAFNFARIEEKPRLIRPFMEICEFIGLKHLEVIGNIFESPELLEVE